jgi:TRAP-type mannitol/chloroaromatic compound transport system substrate-binding protein
MQVPITKLEDFKGLKLRSVGPNALFLNACGAAAAYLPGPEIYPALASKVVVGAHWGAAQGARDMGFYDVNKYHLKPAISIGGSDGWLVNQKALDKLPAEYRDALVTILDYQIYNRSAEYEILENLALAEVQRTKGVKVLTIDPESQKKMTRIAQKLWDDVAAKSPENKKAVDILKKFLKDLGHM